MLTWPYKDPDEVLDYAIDWTELLEGDTIDTSDWIISVGSVVIDTSDVDTARAVATVWLSGGTLGETCEVLNRVVTLGGRTMDRTVRLRIRTR